MKLPVVSSSEVIKALSRAGFVLTRQSGSHLILVKKTWKAKSVVVVPKHKTIAKGTLLSIISQSGLNRQDFLELF